MKYFLPFLLIVILNAGCGDAPPEKRISKVRDFTVGGKLVPRYGEGVPITFETAGKDDVFKLQKVEVVPFEHNICRITLIAPEIPEGQEPSAIAAAMLKKEFNIDLKGQDSIALAETSIRIYHDYRYGMRSVSVEFTDLPLAALAAKIECSERFIDAKKSAAAQDDLKIIEQALLDYKLDIGEFPRELAELSANLRKLSRWQGPYIVALTSTDPWGKPYSYRHTDKSVVLSGSKGVLRQLDLSLSRVTTR